MNPLFGVNLGGWLVAEPWITPALFDDSNCLDEFSLSQTEVGQQRIKNHHQVFMTEEDFRWLAKHQIDAIRLPFGWWVFGEHRPLVGHIEQLDFAMLMAEKYNLKVLLDLHGLPGSQNGLDHSGRIGRADWLKPDNLSLTTQILTRIANRYHKNPTFWGIEVANEPRAAFLNRRQILKFYHQIYTELSPSLDSQHIIFSDSYQPQFFSGKLPGSSWLDMHYYQCFSPNLDLNFDENLRQAAERHHQIVKLSQQQPIIVGEWSLALHNQPLTKDWRQQYFDTQVSAMKAAKAIFFWNYKIDNSDYLEWNFRRMVDQGMLQI